MQFCIILCIYMTLQHPLRDSSLHSLQHEVSNSLEETTARHTGLQLTHILYTCYPPSSAAMEQTPRLGSTFCCRQLPSLFEARTHMPYLTTVPDSAATSLGAMCQKPTSGGSGVFHAGGNGRGTANTCHTACSARDQGRVEFSSTSRNGLVTFQALQSMNTSTSTVQPPRPHLLKLGRVACLNNLSVTLFAVLRLSCVYTPPCR